MIVEQRNYTLHPGKLPEFLDLYERVGLPVHVRHLGALLGYYVVDVGPLNSVMHLWGYADNADRDRRRASLYADPEWTGFFDKVVPLFVSFENRLLRAAPFFERELGRQVAQALSPRMPVQDNREDLRAAAERRF